MDDDGGGGANSALGYWKQNLYLLQERAPKPQPIKCARPLESCPIQYGDEFHGLIERNQAEMKLREVGEGAYLVRESKRSEGAYTLCMFFDGRVLNYKLYFDGTHFVGEKRFESVDLLVADGLISMYMDKHASDYIKKMADEAIYEHSPYMQYTKSSENTKSRQTIARAHNFVQHTFKMPHYCDYCRNFMWGLVQQGVRCEDCGFAAHKKCSERTLHDCRPEAKYVKRIFAVDLTTLCLAHGTSVPLVITACIREVELRGLDVEGVYRVSGSHEHMERLKRQYDSQQQVDLTQVEDIHTVCGLLKMYLRLLPQQLVPFSVYKSLLASFSSTRTAHERTRAVRRSIDELADANAITLKTLLSHLRKVAERCVENKMSVENLSTIFSPTVFCTGITPALPQSQHMLLHFMIQTPNLIPNYK